MTRLNYNQLFYFYVVATEGSVKEASKKLHLTQPTISGQLKTLEEDLGFELFERSHRKLTLNSKGKVALKKAEKIFMMGEELVQTLHGEHTKIRSEVRIGCGQTLSHTFLYEFTESAWKNPDLQIRVIHGDYRYLIGQLDKGELDLVLSDTSIAGSSKRYKNFNLGSQGLVVLGTPHYKTVRKNFPHSLHAMPFMSFGLTGQVHSEIEYFFKLNNIQPDYVGGADDLSLNRTLAETGGCMTILPEKMAKAALKNKRLIKIGEFPEVELNQWAVTSALSSKNLQVRKMINDALVKKRKKTP